MTEQPTSANSTSAKTTANYNDKMDGANSASTKVTVFSIGKEDQSEQGGAKAVPQVEVTTVTATAVSTSDEASAKPMVRRTSDDDFTKMSMLSKRGGGFVLSRGMVDPDSIVPKLPEIPESETHFDQLYLPDHGAFHKSSGIHRTQSERYQRGTRPQKDMHRVHSGSKGVEPNSPKTPTRMKSFRIPRRLRILSKDEKDSDDFDDSKKNITNPSSVTPGHQRHTFLDELVWHDEHSGASSPGGALSATWSFSSNEQDQLTVEPRSRAVSMDRRFRRKPNLRTPVSPGANRKCPPPVASNPRLMMKRKSISDIDIPSSVQRSLMEQPQHNLSQARNSILFDEAKHMSIGRWLGKMFLGPKFGESPRHRIRRLSRDAVSTMMGNSDKQLEISKVLFVGEISVGKRELVQNFRNIGAQNGQQDDALADVISRGTSISENSDDFDPAQLMAFEYNDELIVIDCIFADTEEEFVRHLIQKSPKLIVAVYSVCSPTSLDFCVNMIERLRSHSCDAPVALVGNKSDLVVAREVSKQESRAVAKRYGISLLEVSAMLGDKCPELLLGILRQVHLGKSNHKKVSTSNDHHSVTPQKSNKIWSKLTKTFSNTGK